MAAVKKLNIDWKKKPNTRELFSFVVLLMVLFYGFLDAYLNPKLGKVRELKTNYHLGQQQQDTLEKVIQALDQQVVQQNVRAEEKKEVVEDPRLQKILQYRVQDSAEEIASTITLLSSKRLLKRLIFQEAHAGQHTEHAGYTLVPIEMSLQGHYTALVRYLQDLAELERPVLVNGFEIATNERDAFLKAKLYIELYLPK